jgi:preprotein translocase subunit YajC
MEKNMFITEAMAATEAGAAAAEASPMTGFIIQLILVFGIFYILLIRPMKKKEEERDNMLKAIDIRDEIITGGGVYGRVVKADTDTLTVEIAKGVEIKVTRSSVRENLSKTPVKKD